MLHCIILRLRGSNWQVILLQDCHVCVFITKGILDHISWYFALNHQNHHFYFISVGYVAVSRKLFAYLIYSILLTKKWPLYLLLLKIYG